MPLAALALFASLAGAGAPWLPRVAQALQDSPGWKIDLLWTTKPAEGSLARPRTTSGELRLALDNRFRFEAEGVQVLSDGSTVWQYAASSGQVLVQSVDKLDPTMLPGSLLGQALAGSEVSSTREALSGKQAIRLELAVGKGALARFTRATLWVNPSDLRPRRLSVADAQGAETTWDLRSWKRWSPKPDDFLWKAPSGSETVDLRD